MALETVLLDLNGKRSIYKDVISSLEACARLPSRRVMNSLTAEHKVQMQKRQSNVSKRLSSLIGKFFAKVGGLNQTFPTQDALVKQQGFELLQEGTERLLERVDMFLDKSSTANKKTKVLSDYHKLAKDGTRISRAGGRRKEMRPQSNFPEPPDNSNKPFMPKISKKPNQVVPLQIVLEYTDEASSSIERSLGSHLSTIGVDVKKYPSRYCHPYETELQRLEFADRQYQIQKVHKYKPIEQMKPTWVDNPEALAEMNDHICSPQVREVAMDLEHHSYRSFLGFVCLMQVSTRTRDFLVDTLVLRGHLQSCNEWTTDPDTVKVLHGADSDITWLQGNFGVYVVNMFDTGQASRALCYPSFGLAYLLKHHCDVIAKKQYQMADWRLRPLSAQMLAYAQADTHYLLFIYDTMMNELKEKSTQPKHNPTNLIQVVLDNSRHLCLKRYEKPICTPTSYQLVLSRRNQVLSPAHERIFAALYAWRDRIARQEDESTGYVLPTDSMLQLATKAPTNMAGLIEALNILRPLVRRYAKDILLLIASAKKAHYKDRDAQESGRRHDLTDFTTQNKQAGENTQANTQAKAVTTVMHVLETPLPSRNRRREISSNVRSNRNRSSHASKMPVLSLTQNVFTPIESVAAKADAIRRTMANSVTPSAGELINTPATSRQNIQTPMKSGAATALGDNDKINNNISESASTAAHREPSQSPILQQDELWRLAGWSSPVPVVCDAHNNNFDASNPLDTSLDIQRTKSDLSNMLAKVYLHDKNLIVESEGLAMSPDSNDDVRTSLTTPADAGLLHTSNTLRQTVGPTFLNHDAAKQLWLEATKEMKNMALKQTQLRVSDLQGSSTSNANEPHNRPLSLATSNAFPYSDVAVKPTGDKQDENNSGVSNDGDNSGGIDRDDNKDNITDNRDSDDAHRIPDTMDEIFVLSNYNRRLLKQSEKSATLKDTVNNNDNSNAGAKDDDQPGANGNGNTRKIHKNAPSYSTDQEMSFMEKIRWIPSGTTEQDLGVRANNPPVHKRARVSNSNSNHVNGIKNNNVSSSDIDGSNRNHTTNRKSNNNRRQHRHHRNQRGNNGRGRGKDHHVQNKNNEFDYAAAREASGAVYNPYVANQYANQHRNHIQANSGTHHAGKIRRGHLSRGGGRGSRGRGRNRGNR